MFRRAIARTLCCISAAAARPCRRPHQQTGAMSGRSTDTSGGVSPGVTVEARADVLPSPRVTVTEAPASTGSRAPPATTRSRSRSPACRR
jgi:hypothetical protein